jgi:hypothetical protein
LRHFCWGSAVRHPNGADAPNALCDPSIWHATRVELSCTSLPAVCEATGITPPACPWLAAVRSQALHREAGNRAERFSAASSFCAIHDDRVSIGGAGRDGRRSIHYYSRRQRKMTSEDRFPARRSRTPAADRLAAATRML